MTEERMQILLLLNLLLGLELDVDGSTRAVAVERSTYLIRCGEYDVVHWLKIFLLERSACGLALAEDIRLC